MKKASSFKVTPQKVAKDLVIIQGAKKAYDIALQYPSHTFWTQVSRWIAKKYQKEFIN